MEELFTWQILATYAGATLATSLITQLLKGLPLIKKAPTRLVSYVLALLILLLSTLFTGQLTLQGGLLCFINAAVVSFASNGAFDAATLRRGRSGGPKT